MVRMAQVYRAEHRCLAQTVKQISHMGYREYIKLCLLVDYGNQYTSEVPRFFSEQTVLGRRMVTHSALSNPVPTTTQSATLPQPFLLD